MPGTALVTGVRKPAGGAITSRSVCGVNANGGSPGRELLGGVVAGLAGARTGRADLAASIYNSARSAGKVLIAAAAGPPLPPLPPHAGEGRGARSRLL